ncbi:bifunctional adenosylcobinamide kinase/adenosylcobinamide-phosphate guanylyltransferase [Spirochaeta isovalerica]|uniref:Adenosylcobinamide kinase n=1 Tax=Spirochaeta isovalerica TaxID=150 RepID=A0A841R6R4_9SPIO|nr:bifunctional adenosylcobinamide kinase/adenosylcobinamide-phosphate guanylyltransferase [Spirochaeta isovalerica]MBB6479071.1 adenosylcobinamide kinase/adenosylcobinamide-phosphate guanylyltransferase [Spirochaeta isovalerica]
MGIVLVLGGTKTGKTSFAENRAAVYSETHNVPVYYIATARPFDSEMVERIARHRAHRPAHWETIEEPVKVSAALEPLAGGSNVVLLDCLTLLMTNLIFDRGENCSASEAQDVVFQELQRIIDIFSQCENELIIISNQVENGLVSEHQWARMFQDIAGMAHQKLASAADKVFMMNAGLPLQLK